MQSGDMRELLLADIAVERGVVSAEEAAAALARYWENHDQSVLSGLSDEDRACVLGEIDEVIDAAGGDERLAFAQRGVGRKLTASLPPRASHEISEAGATIRAPLRALNKDRYVGFLPLGQGGMGVVYLALDSELNRRVAFKMIRSGLSDPMGDNSGPVTDDMVARFLQEAIVTGGLEHPGIVPIYELGLAPSGVPYYTMRLVRGERTLEDAIEAATTLEDRLALIEPFLKICDAVGYAHSRGVIHRDLKPANIALGQFGEVVVLDWGLAKMRTRPDQAGSRWQARLDEIRETTDMKTLTSALGTPGYMAPEAALADVDNIDEKSDVYSLGAILFRILTGEFPHTFKTIAEYLAKVTKGIDSVPGAPAGLGRVVIKALDARRDARYADVRDLAAAIRAWQGESAIAREIDGLEVEAEAALQTAESLEGDALLRQLDRAMAVAARITDLRPDHEGAQAMRERARESRSRAIAARERVARRRTVRRAGVVGLLTATAATVFVAFLLNARREEAETARHRAENERARAEDLAGFMLNDLYTGLESVGRLDLLGTVARKSDEYYATLPGDNATVEQRGARALTIARIGEILTNMGAFADAEKSCRQSAKMYEALIREDPGNKRWRYELSVSLNRLGDVQQESGSVDNALASYRQALEIRREIGDEDPLAGSIERVADVLMRKGDREKARGLYDESLALRRKIVSEHPDNESFLKGLALSLEREGDFLIRSEGLAAALPVYEESLSFRKRILEADPSNPDNEAMYASCLFRIGHIQVESGETGKGEQSFLETAQVYRRLEQADPANVSWKRNLSLCLQRLGGLRQGRGDHAGAEERYQDALDLMRAVVARDETNLRAHHDVAYALMYLADLRRAQSDYTRALKEYNQALGSVRWLAEKDESNVEWQDDLQTLLSRVAYVYLVTQRPDEARRTYLESLAIVRRLHDRDKDHLEWRRALSITLDRLGSIERKAGKLVRAEQYYAESVAIRRELSRVDPDNVEWRTDLSHIIQRLAEVRRDRGDAKRAREHFEEAMEVLGRLEKSETQQRELSLCLYNIGQLMLAGGQPKNALETLRRGERIHAALPKYAKEHHFWTREYVKALEQAGAETPFDHLTLGYRRFEQERFQDSTTHFERALRDDAIRNDYLRGNLYNAVCAAARAGQAKLALQWLAEDLRGRRANGDRTRFEAHWDHVRNKDPDLESLRALPEFQSLVEKMK